MRHNPAIVDKGMAVATNLPRLFIVNNALVALFYIILSAIIHTSPLQRVLFPAFIGRTIAREVQQIALGVVVVERMGIAAF